MSDHHPADIANPTRSGATGEFGPSTQELAELLKLAGVPSPRSCLWVGCNATITSRLAPILGDACESFVVGNSFGESVTGLIEEAALPGLPLSVDALPPLSAVTKYAITQADPNQTIVDYCKVRSVMQSNTRNCALDQIRDDLQMTSFDIAIVAGERILAGEIISLLAGSRTILVDGTKTSFGGAAAFAQLYAHPHYLLAASHDFEAGGWALFMQRDMSKSNLPIHFFTIVLNGEPFIRYHEQMMLELNCPWHWHVVEGVASLVKDTAWSVAAGGHIPPKVHNRGKSNDGTTEYLDDLKARFPNKVTIYRKPDDVFWDGKQEMVSAPIPSIQESCLLWQIDADELWTADQVHTVRQKFIDHPERTAAYFWCNYYVGPEKGVSTRYNYAQNPKQEWLRVWRFEPGMKWDKHEPPVLANYRPDGEAYDVGQQAPFTHREMELCGAVFDHFAYTTTEQARFKEAYYGYGNAVDQWQALQEVTSGSGHLRNYFAWVSDETMFDDVSRLEWAPLAYIDPASGEWRFRTGAEVEALRAERKIRKRPRIVVDGVFYQLSSSGIARVWTNLFKEWVRTGYADNVVLIDRAGTAPRIDGVIYHSVPLHDWETVDGDARMLQEVCDLVGADLFISTYYTTPTRTPSVFFGHDMIPEIMGLDLDDLWWQQKRRAIQYAAGHIMVSQSSANDMCRFHRGVDPSRVLVAHNSVTPVFRPCSEDAIAQFREEHGVNRDFIMMVGERFGWRGYKNGGVVFAALAQMPPLERPMLICVGGQNELEEEGRAFLGSDDVKLLKLDDEGLRRCYAAALAYVCPSSLEGFGLPIVEAMAVGCPALVCRSSAIPEVAGTAGVYFDQNDPADLVRAIGKVWNSAFRSETIAAGKVHAASFSQERSAQLIGAYCENIVSGLREGHLRNMAQSLEDAITLAEARRTAETRTAGLQATMDELKRRLASSVRIPGFDGRKPETDAPVAAVPTLRADTSLMIAMERRLANAYAQIRSYEAGAASLVEQESETTPVLDVLEAAQASSTAQEPVFADLLGVQGINDIEGPYPQFGIHRAFRWQVEPSSAFTFSLPTHDAATFELDFSNVEPDQYLRVLMDGMPIGEACPPEHGWDHVWHISFPVEAGPGEYTFTVEAGAHGVIDSDANPRYIAIHGVSVRLEG